jgi:hypothetical protein
LFARSFNFFMPSRNAVFEMLLSSLVTSIVWKCRPFKENFTLFQYMLIVLLFGVRVGKGVCSWTPPPPPNIGSQITVMFAMFKLRCVWKKQNPNHVRCNIAYFQPVVEGGIRSGRLMWHNFNIHTIQHTDLMTRVRFLAEAGILLTLSGTTLIPIGTGSYVTLLVEYEGGWHCRRIPPALACSRVTTLGHYRFQCPVPGYKHTLLSTAEA